MEKEVLEEFQGVPVKITYHNGFTLKGEIKRVNDHSFIFQTTQQKSAIANDAIETVKEVNGRGR